MSFLRRLALVMTVLSLLGLVAACGSGGSTTPKATSSRCDYTSSAGGVVPKKVSPPPGNLPKDLPAELTIATNRGDIKVSLDTDKAPCAVNSFVSLAKQGYFDHTPCHRLTNQGLYVLQCGDPSGTGTGGPGYSFKDELLDNDPRLQPCQGTGSGAVCTYTTGTLAMANSGPDTNGSQFFLVYRDSPLPAAYTDFGRMSAAGVAVVQAVAKGGVAANGTAPTLATTITSVK